MSTFVDPFTNNVRSQRRSSAPQGGRSFVRDVDTLATQQQKHQQQQQQQESQQETMRQSHQERGKVLLIMKVANESGGADLLEVYEQDDPFELARVFCQSHGMDDPTASDTLAEDIITSLKSLPNTRTPRQVEVGSLSHREHHEEAEVDVNPEILTSAVEADAIAVLREQQHYAISPEEEIDGGTQATTKKSKSKKKSSNGTSRPKSAPKARPMSYYVGPKLSSKLSLSVRDRMVVSGNNTSVSPPKTRKTRPVSASTRISDSNNRSLTKTRERAAAYESERIIPERPQPQRERSEFPNLSHILTEEEQTVNGPLADAYRRFVSVLSTFEQRVMLEVVNDCLKDATEKKLLSSFSGTHGTLDL